MTEVKKALAHLSRCMSALWDARCQMAGISRSTPFLWKTYRQALRDEAAGKSSPERDYMKVFFAVRKEARIIGLTAELERRLDNALLDLFNTKPNAVKYREPR